MSVRLFLNRVKHKWGLCCKYLEKALLYNLCFSNNKRIKTDMQKKTKNNKKSVRVQTCINCCAGINLCVTVHQGEGCTAQSDRTKAFQSCAMKPGDNTALCCPDSSVLISGDGKLSPGFLSFSTKIRRIFLF